MSTQAQGCSDQDEIKHALRKLRKKLRQIESLEKLTRPLTIEEIEKVGFHVIHLCVLQKSVFSYHMKQAHKTVFVLG